MHIDAYVYWAQNLNFDIKNKIVLPGGCPDPGIQLQISRYRQPKAK